VENKPCPADDLTSKRKQIHAAAQEATSTRSEVAPPYGSSSTVANNFGRKMLFAGSAFCAFLVLSALTIFIVRSRRQSSPSIPLREEVADII
jgi:hypothetical protein